MKVFFHQFACLSTAQASGIPATFNCFVLSVVACCIWDGCYTPCDCFQRGSGCVSLASGVNGQSQVEMTKGTTPCFLSGLIKCIQ
jgi:hypothetical protein